MKKRICIDIRYLRETPTGVARYILEMAKRVIENSEKKYFLLGDRISLSYFDDQRNLFTPVESPESPEKHPAHDIWFNTSFPAIIKKYSIDIFHATAFMIPFKRIQTKTITTIHDRVAKAYPNTIPWKFRIFLDLNVKNALKKSDHLICMSEFTRNELMKEFKNLPDISVIPLGVADSRNYKTALKSPLSNPYILYVGSIEPRKGIDNLINSFIRLKKMKPSKIKLVIAGKKLWNYDLPQQMAERSEFRDDIIFTGYLKDEEIDSYYNNAELTAIPSLYEGFGLPALEAMRYPVPVLLHDIPVFRETSSKAAFFTDFSNHEKSAKIIINLLESDRDEVYSNNRENLLKYTWDNNAQLTQAVYDKIL